MPRRNGANWAVKYDVTANETQTLVNMPKDMLADLRVLAGQHGCSMAEMVRCLITKAVASEIVSTPVQAGLYRGVLPGYSPEPETVSEGATSGFVTEAVPMPAW